MGVPDPVIGEIAMAIHVRHIQTSMDTVRIFTRASHVAEVAAHMEHHQYDVTPVFPRDTDRTRSGSRDPDGTLWKADLSGLRPLDDISSAVRPLSGSALIDGNAALVELLARFRAEHTFMLVVGGRGLEGVVTPSDMNKQAGRTQLFMQVSALEIALSDRLRAAGRPDEEVLQVLPTVRGRQARSRLAKKQAKDKASDLVAALDFQDLLVIQRDGAGIQELSNLSDQQIHSLAEFRNRVMHAVLEPAGDASDRLETLLAHTALIAILLDALQKIE